MNEPLGKYRDWSNVVAQYKTREQFTKLTERELDDCKLTASEEMAARGANGMAIASDICRTIDGMRSERRSTRIQFVTIVLSGLSFLAALASWLLPMQTGNKPVLQTVERSQIQNLPASSSSNLDRYSTTNNTLKLELKSMPQKQ